MYACVNVYEYTNVLNVHKYERFYLMCLQICIYIQKWKRFKADRSDGGGNINLELILKPKEVLEMGEKARWIRE